MYNVINSLTKNVVGRRQTRKAASRLVDKLDNQHGGYIHVIRDTEELVAVSPAQQFREQRNAAMGEAVRNYLKNPLDNQ